LYKKKKEKKKFGENLENFEEISSRGFLFCISLLYKNLREESEV
jgi:hypothetical protein